MEQTSVRILSNALYVNYYVSLIVHFALILISLIIDQLWCSKNFDQRLTAIPSASQFYPYSSLSFRLVCEGRLCIRKRCAYCDLEWWGMWMTLTFPSRNSVLLRPVHTGDFCCDFLRLLDVNEWNDCSSPEHSWLVYSLTSVSIGEKRTRNCSEIVRVNGSLKSYSVKFIWIFCC